MYSVYRFAVRFLFLGMGIVLAVIVLSGCNTKTLDRSEPTAFKGMELYSWPGELGQWQFSILVGTNRNKTLEEIQANPIDLAEVKRQFCQMAKGEQVFWLPDVRGFAGESPPFPAVPAEIVAELQAQARACEIELYR